MITLLALWLPFALLAVATVWDLRSREIPDAIPVSLLVWAIATHPLHATPIGLVSALEGLGLGLLIALLAFRFQAIGGGDAKLLVALGALLGLIAFGVFLVFVAVAGGLLAVIARVRGQKEVAYAPAFALGWLALVLIR